MTTNSARVGLGLCGLPLEILQQIAGYLADSYRPSLYAFNQTSKTCYQASTLFIFHHINLKIRTFEGLHDDLDNLIKTLSRTDSARQVQSIGLKGFLDIHKIRNKRGSLNTDPLAWWKNCQVDEVFPNQESIPRGEYFIYDESVIKEGSEEDMAWEPLVNFIKTLPSLKRLVYDCPNQFPPSLLHILHKYHPECKLHHLTFRLRTLLWDHPYSYEMTLATSPCLYSIKAICTKQDSEGDDDFNQEAIMELVASLAPNLKEVTIINLNPKWGGIDFFRDRLQWRGLPGFASGTIGSLSSLSLIGSKAYYWHLESIDPWPEYTDFSTLRHLTIGGPGHQGLDGIMMVHIAQNYSFPQLRTLCVCLQRGDRYMKRRSYPHNAIQFFTAFEPLEGISVSGPLEPQILDAILYRHGRTLKMLRLHPRERSDRGLDNRNRTEIPMTFTKDHIMQIQAECPALEDLSVSVKRMQSCATEVEIYRSFTKIEHLKSLSLTLDCSEWRIERDGTYDPHFDGKDSEIGDYGYKQGHLREALMNCAVDETLARSIWETVCGGNKNLESLKLWTMGAGQFGTGQCLIAEAMFSNMSRSWLVERVPRDDKEILNIKELGRSKREARDADMENRGTMRVRPKEIEVFRRLWPSSKEGSKDWCDDWSSIPLEL